MRRAPLPLLLFFSTVAVGAGYLGLAVAPSLALACAASVVGGAGNGVQWVAVVSAVQELTVQGMQARVISVLESIGAAMPGVGYLVGGADRHRLRARAPPSSSPDRASSRSSRSRRPSLVRQWSERSAKTTAATLTRADEIVVELIAGGYAPGRQF